MTTAATRTQIHERLPVEPMRGVSRTGVRPASGKSKDSKCPIQTLLKSSRELQVRARCVAGWRESQIGEGHFRCAAESSLFTRPRTTLTVWYAFIRRFSRGLVYARQAP